MLVRSFLPLPARWLDDTMILSPLPSSSERSADVIVRWSLITRGRM